MRKRNGFCKYVEALSAVTFTNSADETVCKYRLLDVNENQLYVLDMDDYVPYSLDYAVTEEGDVKTVAIDFNSKTEMSLSATKKIMDELKRKDEISGNEITKQILIEEAREAYEAAKTKECSTV